MRVIFQHYSSAFTADLSMHRLLSAVYRTDFIAFITFITSKAQKRQQFLVDRKLEYLKKKKNIILKQAYIIVGPIVLYYVKILQKQCLLRKINPNLQRLHFILFLFVYPLVQSNLGVAQRGVHWRGRGTSLSSKNQPQLQCLSVFLKINII